VAIQDARDRVETAKARQAIIGAADALDRRIQGLNEFNGKPIDEVAPEQFDKELRQIIGSQIGGAKLTKGAREQLQEWAEDYRLQSSDKIADWAQTKQLGRLRSEGLATVDGYRRAGMFGEAITELRGLLDAGLIKPDAHQQMSQALKDERLTALTQANMRERFAAGEGQDYLEEINNDERLDDNPAEREIVWQAAYGQYQRELAIIRGKGAADADYQKAMEDYTARQAWLKVSGGDPDARSYIDRQVALANMKWEDAERMTTKLDKRRDESSAASVALIEADILSYTREEIIEDTDLSIEDTSRLLLKLEEAKSGWDATPQSRRAREYIYNMLRIPPGSDMSDLTEQERLAITDALQIYIDSMEALPADERTSRAREMAEKAVSARAREILQGHIAQQRINLQRAEEDLRNAKGESERKTAQAGLDRVRELLERYEREERELSR
jgi:hypothetical protein